MRSKAVLFQAKDRPNGQGTPGVLVKGSEVVVRASLLSRLRREHWLQSAPCCPQTSMGVGESGQGWGWGREWGRRRKETLCHQYKAQHCFHQQFLCPQSLTDPTYINMKTKKILAQHIVSPSFRMCKEFRLIQWASLGTWPSISEATQGVKSSVRPRVTFPLLGNSQVCCNIINLFYIFSSSFLSRFQTWSHPVTVSPE